ncbi:MAG TPA: BMC domain-containing protein [Pirellulales bacterium]|nr:BMC domain-containing protein [Pirellulales bacterium]
MRPMLGVYDARASKVTIIVKSDVAAVQAAIAAGKQTVERLGGKLLMADVIARARSPSWPPCCQNNRRS